MQYDKNAIAVLKKANSEGREPKAKQLREAFQSVFADLENPIATSSYSLAHLDPNVFTVDMQGYVDDFILPEQKELFNVSVSFSTNEEGDYTTCTVTIAPQIKISGFKTQVELQRALLDLIDAVENFTKFEQEDLLSFKRNLSAAFY